MPDTRQVIAYMDKIASRAADPSRRNAPVGRVDPVPIDEHLATADRHKDAGVRLAARTRFASLKGLVLRVARLYTVEQAGFNHATLAALKTLNHNLESLQVDVDQRLARTQAAMTTADLLQRELSDVVNRDLPERMERELVELRALVTRLGEQRAADRTELAVQRTRVDLFLQEARKRLPEPFDQGQIGRLLADVDAQLAPLYAQLEDAFRGSRQEILERQKEYLPDIVGLRMAAPVVDIGCGRGEWLELLRDNGISAYGVDTNAAFVERNQERGLDVRHGDAIEHLMNLEESSLAAVTGFHLIEHLPFHDGVRLIDAALRALRPGGVLVFETPNPTNVVVGSSSFYMDPTHRNPLHPQFLEFLLTARGFVDVELRYLHPSSEPHFSLPEARAGDSELSRIVEHLNWAFFGPLDFAVVGRKAPATAD